jgi:hypothetical protein
VNSHEEASVQGPGLALGPLHPLVMNQGRDRAAPRRPHHDAQPRLGLSATRRGWQPNRMSNSITPAPDWQWATLSRRVTLIPERAPRCLAAPLPRRLDMADWPESGLDSANALRADLEPRQVRARLAARMDLKTRPYSDRHERVDRKISQQKEHEYKYSFTRERHQALENR